MSLLKPNMLFNAMKVLSCLVGIGLTLAMTLARAGSIGFGIALTGSAITLTHSGDAWAYRVSLWTLDAAAHWQPVQIVSGNSDALAPGQRLTGQRRVPPPATGLGRSDPLLVLFHDQAGAHFAQVAWRRPPPRLESPFPFRRAGDRLDIVPPATGELPIATYAIAMPYPGIGGLTQPFATRTAPPNPVRHAWTPPPPLQLQTGAGQAGAWLVHEFADGATRLQIVPDGVARGQEQTPAWLSVVRQYAYRVAAGLSLIGLLALAAGGLLRTRRPVA